MVVPRAGGSALREGLQARHDTLVEEGHDLLVDDAREVLGAAVGLEGVVVPVSLVQQKRPRVVGRLVDGELETPRLRAARLGVLAQQPGDRRRVALSHHVLRDDDQHGGPTTARRGRRSPVR